MAFQGLLKTLSALRGVKLSNRRFDPTPAAGRPPPIMFRALEPADLAACRDIYRSNEPGRFPPGFLPELEKAIALPDCHFIVGCLGDQIVGFGGIGIPRVATFSSISLLFGLVHPEWHRKGIGSALLLARLSMLPAPAPFRRLTLSTVQESWAYYARFGFAFCGKMEMAGQFFDMYEALMYRQQWKQCAQILEQAGVAGVRELAQLRAARDAQADAERLRDI